MWGERERFVFGWCGGFRYRRSLSLLLGELAALCLAKGRGKYKFALKLAQSSRWGWACRGRGGGDTRLPLSPTGAGKGRGYRSVPGFPRRSGIFPQAGCGAAGSSPGSGAGSPLAINARGAAELGKLPRCPSSSETRGKRARPGWGRGGWR